jgi:glutaredoxin
MTRIVLYGKPGCHLCEDAKTVLIQAQNEFLFTLEEMNILEDDALFNKYVEDIPVVTIDDDFFCQYKVRPEQLVAKLEMLTERRK